MKKRWIAFAALVVLVALLATAVVYAGDTQHWLLYNGDDAYILCADGQFQIDVNGDDTIHVVCHSGDGAGRVER